MFNYQPNDINYSQLNKNYQPWQNRIFDGDYESTFNYLKYSYYKNYINNIFPEISEKDINIIRHNGFLQHLTYTNCIENSEKYKSIEIHIKKDRKVKFDIEYIDLYLFPHNIGIFSFKLVLHEEYQNLNDISDFSNKVRLLYSNIQLPQEREVSLKDFFENQILDSVRLDPDWDSYNPQLKSYIQIDLKGETDEETRNKLIFDLGNVSPLGSSEGKGILAPSQSYYNEQLSNNLISIFKNWSALSLFDTFTRISNDFKDEYRSWEYDYFNIYIHSLYTKFFLYLTSSKLSDVTIVNKETANIRDEFIEFINDELHTHVSYKFLPNLITKKLHNSLGIEQEVERMGTKVLRINEHFQEKRDKTLNIAISLIAFLSVFSSLYDFSEWGISIGYPKELMFPYTSISVGLIIFIVILILLKKKH